MNQTTSTTPTINPNDFTQIVTPDHNRVAVSPSGDIVTFNRSNRRVASDFTRDIVAWVTDFVNTHPGSVVSQTA